MDSPEQPDLLQARPTTLPAVTLEELDQRCQDLRTLLHATLVALIVLALGLGLFLGKQMRLVRGELSELRPVIQRVAVEFRQKEPKMKGFISALQAYAANNRDFLPILDRYRAAAPDYFVIPMAVNTTPVMAAPNPTNTAFPRIQPR
jgi:hypothetical protein